jgi:hypothetical protein
MKNNRIPVLLFVLLLLARPATAEILAKWLGQTVYVPVYSHINVEDRYRGKPFYLTATLSIRNTDTDKPLTLKYVNYHDSEGVLLQKYLDKPITLGPLGSTHYVIPESEDKGGVGAKFLVEWEATTGVTEPIIESVMIGTRMQQGISFISTGRIISGSLER